MATLKLDLRTENSEIRESLRLYRQHSVNAAQEQAYKEEEGIPFSERQLRRERYHRLVELRDLARRPVDLYVRLGILPKEALQAVMDAGSARFWKIRNRLQALASVNASFVDKA